MVEKTEDTKGTLEKWITHAKAENMSVNIIQLFPVLKNVHQQYPTDIIHLDFDRMGFLFDEKQNIRKELVNPEHSFWSTQNPFPINSIGNDDEILSIWDRKPSGTNNLIFTQSKTVIQSLIKLKNENPLNTVLIVGVYYQTTTNEKGTMYAEVCTMYMVRMIVPEDKNAEVQFILTVEPTLIMK